MRVIIAWFISCTSIGTRIDRRDYFKGAILAARMTNRALRPADFLKLE